MKKLLIPALAIMALALTACGDSTSAKGCAEDKITYCYRTMDNIRHCNFDKEIIENQAKVAEEAGNLQTPVYEDCWEM